MLLGNTAVGKTSIFNRVINDSYIADGISNTSAYYRSRVLDVPDSEQKVKLHLWDTAGQEKFFSLTKMYVQDAVGIVLVYDLTHKDSMDGVKAWYNMVQEHLDLS